MDTLKVIEVLERVVWRWDEDSGGFDEELNQLLEGLKSGKLEIREKEMEVN